MLRYSEANELYWRSKRIGRGQAPRFWGNLGVWPLAFPESD